jgi:hypothetical protein
MKVDIRNDGEGVFGNKNENEFAIVMMRDGW